MNLVPTRTLLPAESTVTRSASLLLPIKQALASVAPSTALERVTVLAAEPDSMVWLRAEYAPAAADIVAETSSPAPTALARASAFADLPARAAPTSGRDPTLSYLDAQSAQRATKGALLDVLA